MNALFENPIPILAIGSVFVTIAALAFIARRNVPSLVVLALVILAAALLFLTERFVVTDREHVEKALTEVVAAIERNDAAAVQAAIDPAAGGIRDDADILLNLVRVKQAGASAVKVEVADDRAISHFRGMLSATTVKGGAPVGFFDDVDVTWIKRGTRWLIDGYTPYREGKPINAVGSARNQRPVMKP